MAGPHAASSDEAKQASPACSRVTGHAPVRAAAKDWQNYSSDLCGDRDVRAYRQLPLEADPPRHTDFREALQPLFTAAAIRPHMWRFQRLARSLIDGIVARGGGDVVSDLSLPYVVGCLAIIYNRPQDYNAWLAWGPDVWTAEAYASRREPSRRGIPDNPRSGRVLERSGGVLHSYLQHVFDEAEEHRGRKPESKVDIWDRVSSLVVGGLPVARPEMYGIGSVLLAGGRDTVIKLVTGLVWHLVGHPDDRDYLSTHHDSFHRTIAEMARFLSPLPRIERVLRSESMRGEPEGNSHRYVLLDFASANHDPLVWADAGQVNIHRGHKPHLAFGFGKHSCLGKGVTEHEATAFLTALLAPWPGWTFDGEPTIEWMEMLCDGHKARMLKDFLSLHVAVPGT